MHVPIRVRTRPPPLTHTHTRTHRSLSAPYRPSPRARHPAGPPASGRRGMHACMPMTDVFFGPACLPAGAPIFGCHPPRWGCPAPRCTPALPPSEGSRGSTAGECDLRPRGVQPVGDRSVDVWRAPGASPRGRACDLTAFCAGSHARRPAVKRPCPRAKVPGCPGAWVHGCMGACSASLWTEERRAGTWRSQRSARVGEGESFGPNQAAAAFSRPDRGAPINDSTRLAAGRGRG